MWNRDIYRQISTVQGVLQSTGAAGSWATGISSDYRTYNPANSKYKDAAATRAGNFDPQKSFSNINGSGRYNTWTHSIANNSSATGANPNRLSYLAPSTSRPNAYYWGQDFLYSDPIMASFANQNIEGLAFYRLSDGNKVILDQFKNTDIHWLFYNYSNLDNNLLTLSNSGAISQIEVSTDWQDNTTNQSTPLLFQTHGGIPADTTSTWRTDYARDAQWQTDDRDTYIWYRPNFGSNKQLPTDIEAQGEWYSNYGGGRSGS